MIEALPLQGPGGALFIFQLIGLLVHLAIVVWTYNDAKTNSDQPAILWALVALFFPLVGLLVYLIVGRN